VLRVGSVLLEGSLLSKGCFFQDLSGHNVVMLHCTSRGLLLSEGHYFQKFMVRE